jgi:hypothetical protein
LAQAESVPDSAGAATQLAADLRGVLQDQTAVAAGIPLILPVSRSQAISSWIVSR